MPTHMEIRDQIMDLPDRYVFWTRKEIRALPKILQDSERLLALTSGMNGHTTWLAVCTTQRLIFLDRGMLYGLRQVQFPLERIQSIDHEYALLFGYIRVWDGASDFVLRWVLRRSIAPFVKATQAAMNEVRTPRPAENIAAPSGAVADIAGQLEKLARLTEDGFLTPEEFELGKRKLLVD